ncbi:MAG: helix-turn-helix domain-containing protein [Aureispira sp.]
MKIADNLKYLRQQAGLLQKEVAKALEIGYSNYNKLEKGDRGISLEELVKVAKFYHLTLDEVVFLNSNKTLEVQIQQKTKDEQWELLEELNEEDREIIYKLVNTMLTKQRMKNLLDGSPPSNS